MSYEDYYNSDFQKALREFQDQERAKEEVDIKISVIILTQSILADGKYVSLVDYV